MNWGLDKRARKKTQKSVDLSCFLLFSVVCGRPSGTASAPAVKIFKNEQLLLEIRSL